MVLIMVEATDVLFAIDSIPAIFGITHDPFIVYTSNVCAILGLRFAVFPARRFRSQVCLSETGPGSHPLLYRRQDAPG
jgi:predicted tellurium resistance membrane protein TerC